MEMKVLRTLVRPAVCDELTIGVIEPFLEYDLSGYGEDFYKQRSIPNLS